MPCCQRWIACWLRRLLALLLACGWSAAAMAGEPAERRDRFGDVLPPGAQYRIGALRLQHGGNVRAMAASPDGKLLAAASSDNALSVWEATTSSTVPATAWPPAR